MSLTRVQGTTWTTTTAVEDKSLRVDLIQERSEDRPDKIEYDQRTESMGDGRALAIAA